MVMGPIHIKRPNKLRVEAPTYDIANKIAYRATFSMEYNIYIPSRNVESEGEISDARLSVQVLKQSSGIFRRPRTSDLLVVLDASQLYSASMQLPSWQLYKNSDPF